MRETQPPTHRPGGRIRDARGQAVTAMDPVKLHVLNLRSAIPADTLLAMADELLPGVRRQRAVQLISMAFTVLFIVGGTIVYFTLFSTWKGIDRVSAAIYIVQGLVILAGAVIAFRKAKAKYADRIADVMLAFRRCPHCGYDIRALPTDPTDGATVCPECGCAWRLPAAARPDA